jgi:hypothetical protein
VRRTLFVLAGVLLALGVALAVSLLLERDDEPDAGGRWADVEVTLDPGTGTARAATLRCADEDDSAACEALSGVDGKAWEPVPAGRTCTQEFGGPETATVTGTVDGRRVDATFTRTDGCEIARYSQIEPVLTALELS